MSEYIGNLEYTKNNGDAILVKSRVYKNLDKNKNLLDYKINQKYYCNNILAFETGITGDADWMGLTEDDTARAMIREKKIKQHFGVEE